MSIRKGVIGEDLKGLTRDLGIVIRGEPARAGTEARTNGGRETGGNEAGMQGDKEAGKGMPMARVRRVLRPSC